MPIYKKEEGNLKRVLLYFFEKRRDTFETLLYFFGKKEEKKRQAGNLVSFFSPSIYISAFLEKNLSKILEVIK
jgi:hypothetical protein